MKKYLVLSAIALVLMANAAIAAETTSPEPTKGNSCGEITLKIGNEEFKGTVYPDTYPDGKVIIRMGMPGYKEKPWIAFTGKDAKIEHAIQKAAAKACK